jgi:hypothetical protein
MGERMSDGQMRITYRLEIGTAATSSGVGAIDHPLGIWRHGGPGRQWIFGQRRGSPLAEKKEGTMVLEWEEDGGISVVEGNRRWNPLWSRPSEGNISGQPFTRTVGFFVRDWTVELRITGGNKSALIYL